MVNGTKRNIFHYYTNRDMISTTKITVYLIITLDSRDNMVKEAMIHMYKFILGGRIKFIIGCVWKCLTINNN